MVSFYTPWKQLKTSGFLNFFSEGIERDQWHEMGSFPKLQNLLVHPQIIFEH